MRTWAWGKEAAAWAAVAVSAGFANFLLGCYCGNYGGGGPGSASIYENEPNDTPATATSLGLGPEEFEGDCAADELDQDFFRVLASGTGYAFVEIIWDEGDGDGSYDIDVAVTGSGYAFGDTALPPGDSPIQLEGTVTTSGHMFVQVICKESSVNPVHYTGYVATPF